MPSLRERFESKIDKNGRGGCWLWTASQYLCGYGMFGVSAGVIRGAHRVSWAIYRGAIPDGLYVCHRCDVRLCVNPDHLFLGTCKDNLVDMSNKGRARNQNYGVSICKNGHQFSAENTYINPNTGKRKCRECNRRMDREIYAREKRAA